MMNPPLADDYLRWLIGQIQNEPTDKTYVGLYSLMHSHTFVWLVPNDDNRGQDGLELRAEFCFATRIPSDSLRGLNQDLPTFLEVLIGLSRRLSFAAGGQAHIWAWQLVTNLELQRYYDPFDRRKVRKAEEIIDNAIWRRYLPNGQGGFFPLMEFEEDQSSVELWYQMSAYILEMQSEY